jgi:protein gp37
MAEHTTIQWTESTWNPVRGCSKMSAGCAFCYAEAFAERWRGIKGHPYEQGFDLKLIPEKLEEPLRWKRPRRIFVNSMSDLFHEGVPIEYIRKVFAVMERAHWHTFQILTKRSARLAELAPLLRWPGNVWQGVTVESAAYVDRIDDLRRVPAAVRFLSLEPLLTAIPEIPLEGIDWVIAGGESGRQHRPIDAEWVRDVRNQCLDAGVAFFFKQWGGRAPKKAGRLLDGQVWSAMPTTERANRVPAIGTEAPV